MYEHPSFTYSRFAVEEERMDRANELRRTIAESPSRIVPRAHPVLDRMRGWFGRRLTDAPAPAPAPVAPAQASDDQHVICDQSAQPAHAR